MARLGLTPPAAEPAILGTLKVASSIDSWLSSASFIRTAGVLTEAAIEGKVDHLLDLKSNVIVGKKIPAGTGLKPYAKAGLTYRTEDGYQAIENPTSPHAKVLPDWAPEELKELDEELPQQLDFGAGEYGGEGGQFTRNGRTISAEDARLYLCLLYTSARHRHDRHGVLHCADLRFAPGARNRPRVGMAYDVRRGGSHRRRHYRVPRDVYKRQVNTRAASSAGVSSPQLASVLMT